MNNSPINEEQIIKPRVVFADYLRVIACFMVMCVHATEPFYLGGEGTQVLTHTDALWSTLFDSAMRASVPLFVMASSYLLFPLRQGTLPFFKRRARRVLMPFLVWVVLLGVLFAVQNGGHWADAFRPYVFGFNQYWGHLWFVYMIIGLYLIMPVLSPWAATVSRRCERGFLALWLFSTIVPFFRAASQAFCGTDELWGEANWNEFGTLYYVSGFVGYMILGHHFKRFVPVLSWRRTLAVAVPLWLIGYAITASWFWNVMPHTYPVSAPIGLAVDMEQSWRFSSIGVALTVVGYFMVIRKITAGGALYHRIILPLSKASYGTYLMHMAFLPLFVTLYRPLVGTGACILLTAVSTFVVSSLLSIGLSYVPCLGKYITGCEKAAG